MWFCCGFAADLVSVFADVRFAADLYERYVFKNITMAFCCMARII